MLPESYSISFSNPQKFSIFYHTMIELYVDFKVLYNPASLYWPNCILLYLTITIPRLIGRTLSILHMMIQYLFPLLSTFQNRTSIIQVPKWENGMIFFFFAVLLMFKRDILFWFRGIFWLLWLLIKHSIIWWIRWPRFKFWLFHLLAANI